MADDLEDRLAKSAPNRNSENKVGIEDLDQTRLSLLERAICNVLDTDGALYTFAQLIDGLPLRENIELYHTILSNGDHNHPVLLHKRLCTGALEKAQEYRGMFDIRSLSFDEQLLRRYETALEKSRDLRLRLIELTVAAIHQIAAYIFQQRHCVHDSSTTEGQDVSGVICWLTQQFPPSTLATPATLFLHRGFDDIDRYPNGLADVVGYWAEDCILGGVFLFDHSRSWIENDDEPNLYVESGRNTVTYEVWQVLDKQQDELINFLLSDSPTTPNSCPFPILPSAENKTRIDPDEVLDGHRIYRDNWERRVVGEGAESTGWSIEELIAHYHSRRDPLPGEDTDAWLQKNFERNKKK